MRTLKGSIWAVFLVLALCAPATASASLTDNLVGYWAFDETSGSTASDSSVTGNNGTITGTASWVAGKVNNALSFNGSTYVTIDRPVEDDMTLCAWIQTSTAGNGIWHYQFMQIMESEVGGAANDFGFGVSSNGKLGFGVGELNFFNTDPTDSGATTVTDGEWHFVCVTRALPGGGGAAAVKLYVDGVLDGSSTFGSQTLDDNPNALIGGAQDGGKNFVGLI